MSATSTPWADTIRQAIDKNLDSIAKINQQASCRPIPLTLVDLVSSSY